MKKAVIIPAYKVSKQIVSVILGIPESIDHIIVIDDKCPENSGKKAEEMGDRRVIVVYHEKNLGVGGATITGYQKAMELGAEIMVKMDGDGQMDSSYIDSLIAPIVSKQADYAKGNRFGDLVTIKSMPPIRLFGNSLLSFFVKFASGYWNIMDPTNGFTALHRNVLSDLNLNRISKGYFFEISMLINMNCLNIVVSDVSIPARYGEENSSLKIWKAMIEFPFKLFRGFVRRIFFKYYIYDFNMASVYMLLGLPMFIFGVILGINEWIMSILTGVIRSPGTIMLTALPIIISFQMLLQAINIDINSTPRK
jgi:glycosyltransferase involved in cell wall biosynthesis